jgi:hypothetical protein
VTRFSGVAVSTEDRLTSLIFTSLLPFSPVDGSASG